MFSTLQWPLFRNTVVTICVLYLLVFTYLHWDWRCRDSGEIDFPFQHTNVFLVLLTDRDKILVEDVCSQEWPPVTGSKCRKMLNLKK